MMKGKGVAIWMATVGSLLVLGGCTGTGGDKADLSSQVQQLKTALDATKNERDLLSQDARRLKLELDKTDSALAGATQTNTKLQSQVQDLTKSRDELSAKVEELSAARTDLQKRVDELTASRDQLQTMVEGLVDTRGTLEKQVAILTKARDAARADAVTAQAKMDQLNEKLKGQTQQMVELQDQMASVRVVLRQLQQKLE
jgi:chromosome segregation ATPase